MKNYLISFLIIFLLGVVVFIFLADVFLGEETLFFKKELENSTITFLAVGDIILDRGVKLRVKNIAGGDYKFPFLRIIDHLKKADILFGNLENVISDKEGRKIEKTGPIREYLKAEPQSIEGLKYAGFDILSVANNHILDYGREAMEDCLKRLEVAGIEYVGAGFNDTEAFFLKIKKVKDTKIGFLAYTYPKYDRAYVSWKPSRDKSGVAVVEKKEINKIREDIKRARKQVDILVVSFHWGNPPFSFEPNPYQVFFGKELIDSGVDLIVGHHPHVIQPIERYKNGWIVYSLGNFVFDMHTPEAEIGGLLEVTIQNKKIKEVKLRRIKISKYSQPYLIDNSQ